MPQEKADPNIKPFPQSHLHCMIFLSVANLTVVAGSTVMEIHGWMSGFAAGLIAGLGVALVLNTIYYLQK